MHRSHLGRKGFTLIEVLTVVVIIGILAAIVVPSFSRASADSAESALRTDLQYLRSTIQRYEMQHGKYPDVTKFTEQMTQYTDSLGNTSATKTGQYRFGPYMTVVPKLPVGSQQGQRGVTGALGTAGAGWCYDASTGHITANLGDGETDHNGNVYNRF